MKIVFAALLFVLERCRHGHYGWLWLLPPIFAVWTNLHGGWIVGAGVLAIFVACAAIDRNGHPVDRATLIAAAVASAVATLVNPYGPRMLGFLLETVRPGRADISEWQQLARLPLTAFALWSVPTSIAIAAVWRNRRLIARSSIAITIVLGLGALLVARLTAFYAVAVGFLLAPHVAPETRLAVAPARRRPAAWATGILACAATTGLAVLGFGRQLAMDGPWLPEREAALYVRAHHLRGTMFTWFDYGEYAIWHFWPAIRVSMDGRRETVYSEAVRDVHFGIYRNAPEAVDELARINPDYVWLPAGLPVVARLEARGWHALFRGSRSIVLSRQAGTPATTVVRVADQEPRYFPGP